MDDLIRNRNEKLAAFQQEIDTLKETLSTHVKEKEYLSKTFTVFKTKSKEKESKYIDKEIVLEKQNKELESIICKMYQSTQAMHMLTKPQVFYDNTHKQALGYQNPFHLRKAQGIKPTLCDGSVIAKEHDVISVIDDEETLILEEESQSKMLDKQNDPISIKQKINISPFDYSKLNKIKKIVSNTPVRIEAPSKLSKVSLVNESLKKLKYQLANFDKVVKKRTTSDAITADEITEVQTVFNQMEAAVDQCSVDKNVFEIQIKQLHIDNDQLLKEIMSQEIVHIVVNFVDILNVDKSYVDECNKCLELETKLHKKKDLIEEDVYGKLLKSYSTLEKHCISLELTTQLNQEIFQKDNFCENQNAPTFNQFFEINELKAQSQEMDTSVENLDLNAQLQEKVFDIAALKNELRKLKGKNIVDIAVSKPSATIAPGMFKLDINPFIIDLRTIGMPMSLTKPTEKLVFVTPMNKEKKVRFAESVTSSSNISKNTDSLKTKYSNNPLLTSTDVVQIVMWYLDSECSKHVTGNRSQLITFVSKFLGTVRFGNDHIAKIRGYGDYQIGNVTISQFYYVEGICHNLFSMGQFCDSDLEYQKDHLCSSCDLGKSKKHFHKPRVEDSIQEKLYLLHMDLCGPMGIQSFNGRKYILVIVDDYSRFTWVKFLRSKDEVPEFVIKFLKMIQVRLNAIVCNISTDNGTELVNQTLRA
ncbi:retrovirus-related pol polyprotein from transposon TNT 1-94 [Tanacetum coccineum]